MKTLHLTLKKKWFDMIASGEKKEEYREIKSFWSKRITSNPRQIFVHGIGLTNYTIHREADDVSRYQKNGLDPSVHYFKRSVDDIKEGAKWIDFETVTFTNGYAKDAPQIIIECKGIEVGNAKPEWSDNWQGEVFIIKLGKILKEAL